MHGNVDARAKVGEVFEGFKSATTLGIERRERRSQQIAERLAIATTHATTHLVQIGESEVVRTIDDDGVGIRYVDTILDDGGREQHVVVVVREVEDDFLQLFGFHLSVADSYTGIGHVLLDDLGDMFEVGYAIVDKVNLTVAAHLEVDGIGYNLGRKSVHLGLYGIAVGRRRLDDTEVARTH